MNTKSKKKKMLKYYKKNIALVPSKKGKESALLILFRTKKELERAGVKKISFHKARKIVERNQKEPIYVAYNVDWEEGFYFAPIRF